MRVLLTTILSLFLVQFTYGQAEFDKFIPSAPNAASLAKYAITPVSYYTGIPNIDIPIYTIQTGNTTVPITLSYHAGGIKISEESSSVGLGWTLNAGGAVTRSLGYKDDFDLYLSNPYPMPDPPLDFQGVFNPSSVRVIQREYDCTFPVDGIPTVFPTMDFGNTISEHDWIPDTFFYNFNGHSGSFWLGQDGNVHQSKKTDVSITLVDQLNGEWEIKTADGMRYEFKKPENTYITQYTGDGGGYVSSWHLTKIIAPSGEEVEFIYDTKESYSPIRSFTQQFNYAVGTFTNSVGKPVAIEGIYLSEIRFKNGRVLFTYSDPGERLDIGNTYYVKSIEVYSELITGTLELIKKFDLVHSYFGPGGGGGTPEQGDYYDLAVTPDSHPSRRLRLNAVVENQSKTYAFDYYNSSAFVPTKTTFAQDYWGYYNGKGGPPSFIPVSMTNPVTGELTPKANRSADVNKAKEFILTKITYPTGGYTTFEHELNTYKLTGTAGGTIPQTVVQSENNSSNGGLTEKTIIVGGTGQVNLATTAFVKEVVISGYDDFSGIYNAYQYVGPDDLYVELLDEGGSRVEKMTFSQMFDPGATYTSTILGLSSQITVPPGTYTLRSYVNPGHFYINGNAAISVSWEEAETSPEENYGSGGGLRIKSISDFTKDGALALKRNFNYHYTENITGIVTSSHGRLMRFPEYDAWFRNIVPGGGTPNNGLQASSSTGLSMEQGSFVGYDQVRVATISGSQKNGETIYKYRNQQDLYFPAGTDFSLIESEFYEFPPIRIPSNGILYAEEQYQVTDTGELSLIRKVENEYEINGIKDSEFVLSDLYQNPDYVLGGVLVNFGVSDNTVYDACDDQSFLFHPYYTNLIQQVSSQETRYDMNGGNPVTSRQNFYYDNDIHLQRTQTEIIYSTGDTLRTRIYYPDDILSIAGLPEGGDLSVSEYNAINALKKSAQHRIGEAVQTVTYKIDASGNQQLVSLQRTRYKDWGGGMILPEKIAVAKGQEALKNKFIYEDYDVVGHPLEMAKENGTPISYIWGYNNTKPIARLEGVAYSDIDPATIANLQSLSDNDTDALSEQALRDALNSLRTAHPKATFTGFTYEPLIGMTSSINQQGKVSFFSYDDFNRLSAVKDNDTNITEAFAYHYAQEAVVYDPLLVGINYGTDDTDHQWFTSNTSGGSGDYSYAWFEGVGDSSTDFDLSNPGTNDTYQLMVNCAETKYVKLVVTDNVTGEVMEQTRVNNNSCPYSPLTVNVTYGSHSDTYQNFTSMVSGGSGNVTYAWHKGVDLSSFTFETTVSGTQPNFQLQVPCSTYRWMKLVVTDTVTGESVIKVTKSDNSPCSGGEGGAQPIDPFDPEQ